MPANWGSFQSAIQLAAGTNIALYALPNLSQPVIETETRRWMALLEASRWVGEDLRKQVRLGSIGYHAALHDLERQAGAVRHFALWMAVVATIVLVIASCYPGDPPNSPFLWGALIVCAVPALILAGINLRARRRIGQSSDLRHTLEAQCAAGQ